MNPYAKLHAGASLSSISVRGYNGAMDAARDYRARLNGHARGGTPEDLLGNVEMRFASLDADLDWYQIITNYDSALSSDADGIKAGEFVIEGGTPPTAGNNIFVTQEPIPKYVPGDPTKNIVGRALAMGVTPCYINLTDASHWCATTSPGEYTRLKSAESGQADILWKSATTGSMVLCVIRLGNTPPAASSGSGLKWGKAYADWEDAAGNGSHVSCKDVTDKDGAGENGNPFDVYLPRAGGRDPNVRAGDVIGYLTDSNGVKICVTDYLDDPLLTVKTFAGTVANIQPGWHLCDGTNGTSDMRARFQVGLDPRTSGDIPVYGDANYQTLGNTGGFKNHGDGADNNHTGHGTDYTVPSMPTWPSRVNVLTSPGTHSATDNRPPYYVLAYIQRIH